MFRVARPSRADTEHTPDLTPVVVLRLAIVVLNNGTGPTCAMMGAGYVHDSVWYTGYRDESTLMDSVNDFAHVYYSNTSTLDFGWQWANETTTNGSALAVSFKTDRNAVLKRKQVEVMR